MPVFQKILKLLNIHPDANQRWILSSYCISYILMAFISPMLAQTIYSSLPTRWFSFSALFGSISGLLAGVIWQGDVRKNIMRNFLVFCISESSIGFILGMYMSFFNQNMWVYAITALIYSNLVCIMVSKCIMAFKSVLWNNKEREIYDNNLSNICYITMIIGYLCSLIYVPSLKLSLFLFGLSCIFDDLGWIIVYVKNKESLRKID